MSSIQYTIRNIPEPINRYLRKKSRISGKSLNRVIIEELSARVAPQTDTVGTALGWFIGSEIDDETLKALAEEDKIQKTIANKEM